jgi:hypothetical protein
MEMAAEAPERKDTHPDTLDYPACPALPSCALRVAHTLG